MWAVLGVAAARRGRLSWHTDSKFVRYIAKFKMDKRKLCHPLICSTYLLVCALIKKTACDSSASAPRDVGQPLAECLDGDGGGLPDETH